MTDDTRKIVQEISGFYPLFEALLNHYKDEITPAVFGVAWRYCQMEDGVCKASLRTIAGILNISEATVMRRMETLCNDGYLIDTTPNLRNTPHVYVDAGLVVMKSALGAVETVSHRNRSKSTVSHRNASVSQGNTTVSQSQLIKDSIKESIKQTEEDLATISKSYEHEIGIITDMIRFELIDASDTYPLKWVLDAIHEAAVQNKRGWKYCLAILKRWDSQGNQNPIERGNGKNKAITATPAGSWLARKEQELANGNAQGH